jgi:hypothetical protein
MEDIEGFVGGLEYLAPRHRSPVEFCAATITCPECGATHTIGVEGGVTIKCGCGTELRVQVQARGVGPSETKGEE